MRKNLPLVIVAFFVAATLCIAQTGASSKSKNAGGSNLEQMIIDKARESWEAYKNRDVAAIKALTAEEYVAYTLQGPATLKQDIDNIGKLTIESYRMDDPKVTMATKDVAILRYKCDLKGSADGKQLKPVYATEVWVNRGGKWQIISYQETPVS